MLTERYDIVLMLARAESRKARDPWRATPEPRVAATRRR
jgi:hypothetical protein